MIEPGLTNSRQPHELLSRILYHCMISRWDYIGRVSPYLACIAAGRGDVVPLLATTPADPIPTKRPARRHAT